MNQKIKSARQLKHERKTHLPGAVLLLFLLAFFCAALPPQKAYASNDSSFTTSSYDVDIVIGKDHTCEYTETISVDFSEPKHGIYRSIPTSDDYKIKDISVEDYHYSVSNEDWYKVIQIGSSSKTLTGLQTYQLHYTLKYYKDSYRTFDELYLNIFPTNWSTDVGRVSVNVQFPDDFDMSSIETYSGNTFSTAASYGSFEISEEDHTLSFEAEDLPQGIGATIRGEIPDGYWINVKKRIQILRLLPILFGLGGTVLLLFLLFFARGGKSDTIETVEFYPPDNLSPPEIGYAWDDSCDDKDITALLFDLAAKGYIRIEEFKSKNGNDGSGYAFIKLKDPPETENRYERCYFQFIFGKRAEDKPEGTRVLLSQCKKSFYSKYQTMKEMIDMEFSEKKKDSRSLYSKRSMLSHKIMTCAEIAVVIITGMCAYLRPDSALKALSFYPMVLIITGYIVVLMLFGSAVQKVRFMKSGKAAASAIITGVVYFAANALAVWYLWGHMYTNYGTLFTLRLPALCYALFCIAAPFCSGFCRQRSGYGAQLYGKIRGFRTFIETAEADRLNELLRQDPNYYYRILPYAYVFDLVKNWGENFKDIAVPPPDWYASYNHADPVNIFIMTHHFNSISSQITTQINADRSAHASSTFHSSGGGGGGFVGGGGGGGGGGAW